mmetsp:Transcript_25720/g.37966  ORF Transcript_25720/g.37966 Transcript_25720/m.37966 type:complete len:189 (+) Transcript_25720:33-599(+)
MDIKAPQSDSCQALYVVFYILKSLIILFCAPSHKALGTKGDAKHQYTSISLDVEGIDMATARRLPPLFAHISFGSVAGFVHIHGMLKETRKEKLMTREVSTRQDGYTHKFMGNKAPDTHHSSTSVIQFNCALLQLCCIIKFIPTKIKGAVTVVTYELCLVIQPSGITVDNLSNNEEGSHLVKDVHAIL